MYSFAFTALTDAPGYRIQVMRAGYAVAYAEFLAALQFETSVARDFTACLASTPPKAFAWECRSVTRATLSEPLDMVVIESPALEAARADLSPFAAQLRGQAGKLAMVFDNLSGDARLVVPRPVAAHECYAHLATFVRSAPGDQVAALWAEVARAVEARLRERDRPLWVSTAGLGVSWLHVRLDDRPEYYRYLRAGISHRVLTELTRVEAA